MCPLSFLMSFTFKVVCLSSVVIVNSILPWGDDSCASLSSKEVYESALGPLAEGLYTLPVYLDNSIATGVYTGLEYTMLHLR